MIVSQVVVLPTCAICHDEDEGVLNAIVVTRCGHIFHSHCLEEWYRHERAIHPGNRCPYCNTTLPPQSPYPFGTSNTLRLHQLTQQRVSILSEEDPCPEEQLRNLQLQINSTKLDLNKESAKVLDQERGNAELVAENTVLEATIKRLREELQSYNNKTDEHATLIQKEQETHKEECAAYLKEEERLRIIAGGLAEGQERVKGEKANLHALLERKERDRLRLSGLAASQSGTIRILEAQAVSLNREKHELYQMIDITRESQKKSSGGKSIESDRSHHLMNVMMALSGRFSKLESECSSLKQMLETREDANDQLETTADDSVKDYPGSDEAINTSLKNPLEAASLPILQTSSESNTDRAKGKQKMVEGFVPKMSALEVSQDEVNENMDPRLFA
ncbi:hypothetical protein PTTG_11909 [Puccinia triticina 1-1 BBBD Race 1]|uniref:RING-type domain-containing protein n=2 Tax=Puccinia triticina TaxID=208348 RepID=A0A180GUR0_PUCT1|nr:uncharacterized protein PtA15_5A234 [Puccinia triticina]OAV96119.1 hypothetical protein PTTG_11909 [Puccinia triticina 1-1 BBBD Race 1]WAQ84661.1 hypothetical protein PtA15_5A234 [Puccinia triticina]WAR58007.1 hypothetical protein PtB15_5B237 [Puccinia triticina]